MRKLKEMNTAPKPTPEQRFWKYVDVVDDADSCWLWRGTRTGKYGQFWDGVSKVNAHRYSYLLAHGSIDAALTIDHLCKTPMCVRPSHLEQVSLRENVLRGSGPSAHNRDKTHCKNGHEFTPENTYSYIRKGLPQRSCRECGRKAWQRWHSNKP